MTSEPPPGAARALQQIVDAVAPLGFKPVRFTGPEGFGNLQVEFTDSERTFTIVRDRGQFFVSGAERSALEAAGLWAVRSGSQALVEPLLKWLKNTSP